MPDSLHQDAYLDSVRDVKSALRMEHPAPTSNSECATQDSAAASTRKGTALVQHLPGLLAGSSVEETWSNRAGSTRRGTAPSAPRHLRASFSLCPT